jgi:hypothetical protein
MLYVFFTIEIFALTILLLGYRKYIAEPPKASHKIGGVLLAGLTVAVFPL